MVARISRWHRSRLAIAGAVLGLLAGTVAAQESRANSHVRGLDSAARRLLGEARAGSPAIAGLIAKLDESDVIVLVSITFMREGTAADTRFITVTASARILSLRIDVFAAPRDKIEYLGHELQHAFEVAQAPEVQNDSSLRALMTRIGRTRDGGRRFETDGAIAMALRVRRELGAVGPR